MTKFFKFVAAQGELRFVRLPDDTAIPDTAVPVPPKGDRLIVGHSETGHDHYMDAGCAVMHRLPDSILDCLLVVSEPTTLNHLRDFDTHEPLAFEKGVYRVTTGREYAPEGWRRSQD